MKLVRKLHTCPAKSAYNFDIWEKTEEFVAKIKKTGQAANDDFLRLYNTMKSVCEYVRADHVKNCICHCDCYAPNFLINERGKMYLIDWEYSGNSDPSSDLGTFICCADYTYEQALDVIRQYYENDSLSEKDIRHTLGCVAMASYYWYMWAIFQENNGTDVGEYLRIWYNYSKQYARKTIELYREA